MPQLKVGPVLDDRPVKRTIELPASIDRLLVDYAKVASEQAGASYKPEQLVPQMLQRFIATDRAFTKLRKAR